MRIVGGTFSGRVLRAPAGAATRPTSEKVREALFNILGRLLGPIDGAHVLDVFAGSGGVGIEALSRGAAHATFIDSGKAALLAIRGNLADLGLTDRATVLPQDAVAACARHRPAEPWRLVFVDPPYASDLATRAVIAIPSESLAPGAVIVIEHDRRNAPPDALGSLLRTDQRRYGDTMISFYEVPA
ncbi:MAG: 16S rRNA (guanine(966)-N(2))-methyltransferase RsmD [Deltaproteobacteria bacterium]|nr:16S rRNA (guanine(966)-N(2))-methyltransferase RsmD [Deltaproteobacteria bacterium]MDQ3301083.1 16S rRNA (guanine(966)-N(2))-methyltransferase RsmD [Myxococcota bacterium]